MSISKLEKLIEETKKLYQNNEISKDEYVYTINQIKDIQAAEELAGDEIAIRRVVEICEIALTIV